MKKLISLSLALVLILSLCAVLTSCEEHVCEFKEEWKADQTYHWHECIGDNCLETAGKAEHEWDEGTLNGESEDETAADMTYTCKVCGTTKGESVALEGAVAEEQWEAAVADQKFDNVTIHYTFDTESDGKQEHVVKITENKVYRSIKTIIENEEISSDELLFEGEEAAQQRDMFLAIFLSLLAEKENFAYDLALKAYKMPEEVQTRLEQGSYYILETMRDGVVTFDAKGNVTSFVFWISEAVYDGADEMQHESKGTITLNFSDYGTTVVE